MISTTTSQSNTGLKSKNRSLSTCAENNNPKAWRYSMQSSPQRRSDGGAGCTRQHLPQAVTGGKQVEIVKDDTSANSDCISSCMPTKEKIKAYSERVVYYNLSHLLYLYAYITKKITTTEETVHVSFFCIKNECIIFIQSEKMLTLVSLVVYCGYTGIQPPSATRDNQSPSPWFYSARPTKRALVLYTITVDHESCAWQQGTTNEDNRTESNCTHW